MARPWFNTAEKSAGVGMLSVKEFERRMKKAALEALEAARHRVAEAWRFRHL